MHKSRSCSVMTPFLPRCSTSRHSVIWCESAHQGDQGPKTKLVGLRKTEANIHLRMQASWVAALRDAMEFSGSLSECRFFKEEQHQKSHVVKILRRWRREQRIGTNINTKDLDQHQIAGAQHKLQQTRCDRMRPRWRKQHPSSLNSRLILSHAMS